VAAQALGNIRSPEAQAHLSAASRTRHPKVRRAVAQALGNFRNEQAAKTLARMAKGDASVLVSAAAARSLGATRHELAFDTLVELLERPSWAEVLRAGAIGGLARLRDERGVAVLRDHTKYGVPTRARRAAIASLPTLSHTRKTREVLEELLDESDPHLRVSVTDALAELGDVKARGALRRQLERDLDARVRRRIREVLRDLGGKGRRETRRLREELDDLRREHAELKVRLSKIEERVGDKPKRRRKR
jgi:aminopeptidase N